MKKGYFVKTNHCLTVSLLLGLVFLGGCLKNAEKEATAVFQEAESLVESGRNAEKKSYSDALKLYQDALKELETIEKSYPDTEVAGTLADGEARIGPFPLEEFKESVLPAARLKALAEKDVFACALLAAKNIETDKDKLVALIDISRLYPKDRNDTVTSELYVGLSALLESAEDNYFKHIILIETACRSASPDELNRFTGIARGLKRPYMQVNVLVQIGKLLAENGRADSAGPVLEEAVKIAQGLEKDTFKVEPLSLAAQAYEAAGDRENADRILSILHRMLDREEETYCKGAIAVAMATLYEKRGTLEQVEPLFEMLDSSDEKATVLCWTAEKLLESSRKDKALEMLKQAEEQAVTIEATYPKRSAIERIIKQHLELGHDETACQLVEALNEVPEDKLRTLRIIINKYIEDSHHDKALPLLAQSEKLLDALPVSFSRAGHTATTARLYAMAGRNEKTLALLPEARKMADGMMDCFYAPATLAAIAESLHKAGKTDEALEKAAHSLRLVDQLIDMPGEQARVLARLSGLFLQSGHEKEADEAHARCLEALLTFEDNWSRWSVNIDIIDEFLRNGHVDLAKRSIKRLEGKTYEYLCEARMLAKIARHLCSTGVTAEIAQILSDAAAALEKEEEKEGRIETQVEVGELYIKAGFPDHAVKLSNVIAAGGGWERWKIKHILLDAARVYAAAQQHEKALAIAESIPVDRLGQRDRDEAFAALAAAYANQGDFDRAFTIADRMEDEEMRARGLARIATAYARSGKTQDAVQVLALALQEANRMYLPYMKAEVLLEIATGYTALGQDEQAHHLAASARKLVNEDDIDKSMKYRELILILLWHVMHGDRKQAVSIFKSMDGKSWEKNGSMKEFAEKYFKDENNLEALWILEHISDQTPRQRGWLETIARRFQAEKKFTEAFRACKAIKHPGDHLEACAALAEAYVENDLAPKALKLVGYMLKKIKSVKDPDVKACLYARIACLCSKAGKPERAGEFFSRALETANKFDRSEAFDRNYTLRDIALAWCAAGNHEKAMEIAQSLEKTEDQGAIMKDIALHHLKAGRAELSAEVLSGIGPEYREYALMEIARFHTDRGQYDQAVRMVKDMKNTLCKPQVLALVGASALKENSWTPDGESLEILRSIVRAAP